MIEPGINLCNRCGKTSTGFYYCSDDSSSTIWELDWDNQNQKLQLKARDGDPFPKDFPQQIDPNIIDLDNFPPYTIEAPMSYDSSQIHTYTRCCPKCGKAFDNDWIGKVPGYVIAVMGTIHAGKTSWLDALSTTALAPVNAQSYSHWIIPAHFTGSEQAIVATMPGSIGGTNYFRIVDKQTRETAALVYLLDFAGELYRSQEVNPTTPLGRLLMGRAGEGYSGIDGLVLIEPAKSCYLDSEACLQILADAADLTASLSKVHGTDNIPIAHVLTFGDKFLAEEMRKPLTPDSIHRITKATFPSTAYTDATYRSLKRHFTPEAIHNRFLLHQTFHDLGENSPHLETLFQHNTCHFLVQSCSSVKASNNDLVNNYTTQFNVVDPLIWLLHNLLIFPPSLNHGGNPYV